MHVIQFWNSLAQPLIPLHTPVQGSEDQIDIPLPLAACGLLPMLYLICLSGPVTTSKQLRGTQKSEKRKPLLFTINMCLPIFFRQFPVCVCFVVRHKGEIRAPRIAPCAHHARSFACSVEKIQ